MPIRVEAPPSPSQAPALRFRLYSDPYSLGHRSVAAALFVAWLAVVASLSWTHIVWRDEVRALSFSLQGGSVFTMLKELRGEGHPAIWYLLLRAVHTAFPHPEALLITSLAVAATATLILALRAPFSLPLLVLILLSRFSIFEYSVIARNYGISMLVLFLFAVFYERHRDKDCLPGVLLFLLANTNVPSALLAAGLLLFWFVDVLGADAARRGRSVRIFIYNAVITAFGALTCFITVFPTIHDAAVNDSGGLSLKTVVEGIILPSMQLFDISLPNPPRDLPVFAPLASHLLLKALIGSTLLFGSTLGLVHRTGAFLAALFTLVGFAALFLTVYPGMYRHQALWLVFMISLYWLAAPDPQKPKASPSWLGRFAGPVAATGKAFFILLLLLELPYGIRTLGGLPAAVRAGAYHRKHDLKSILAERPELTQAVIISDRDFLLETLPYYIPNPTYLVREQRFGNTTHFTRRAELNLSLADILTNGRELGLQTRRPVVILMYRKIDPAAGMQVYEDGYDWKFIITPEQARAFQLSTQFLAHVAAPANNELGGDETYDAFVMDQ